MARIYDRDPDAGLAAARLGARLIAADLIGTRHQRRLPAARRRAGQRRRPGDRRPRLWRQRRTRSRRSPRAIAEGLADGGVLPVLKHIPGHGRANADSHEKLPVVHADRATLEATDFAAFRPLKKLPLGMTAHVVFTAIDPVRPATTSATMIGEVIRGFIGFDGLLMSDDVSMGALSGSIAERARASLAAGCDLVLHCNGKMDEMRAVAAEAPELAGEAARRADGGFGCAEVAVRRLILPAARREFAAMMTARDRPDERSREHSKPNSPSAAPTSRRCWSTSRASRARSICCSRSPASRRSISRKSRSWRWPSSISPSSRRRGSCGSSSPPTIW